ncbi:MAG: hypothetical protein IKZ91_00180 [Bacteroidales bacterium]|nr:hypothetical protein [Bacteroidales bacterium]
MKKVFFAILSTIAIIGMVASCEKDPKNPNNPNGGNDEPEAVITIDGDFSDWSSAANVVSTEVPADLDKYANMLKMKGVADADNIYLYFEYQLADGQLEAPFDIFFDADGNASTGFISWLWSKEGCGWDYLLETEGGILVDGTSIADLSDMNIYWAEAYTDPVTGEQVDGWGDGASQKKLDTKDFAEAKGVVKNGVAIFEVSVMRSCINALKKGSCGVAITISDAGWNTMGVLPIDESGAGTAEFMQIALP